MPTGIYIRTEEHRKRLSEGQRGHSRGGWKFKDTSRMKGRHVKSEFRKGNNMNDNNVNWKDNPSMTALHNWIRRRVSKPDVCPECKTDEYVLELANISQEYKRDINDFEWLCHMCHMTKDGRMNRLFQRKEGYGFQQR